jgi:hypothetical protein
MLAQIQGAQMPVAPLNVAHIQIEPNGDIACHLVHLFHCALHIWAGARRQSGGHDMDALVGLASFMRGKAAKVGPARRHTCDMP